MRTTSMAAATIPTIRTNARRSERATHVGANTEWTRNPRGRHASSSAKSVGNDRCGERSVLLWRDDPESRTPGDCTLDRLAPGDARRVWPVVRRLRAGADKGNSGIHG